MQQLFQKVINRYKSLPVPVKASFFFVFCGLFKDAVDVLTTPVFTRLLTTEEFGLFGVYNSWYQILRIFVTLSLFSDIFNVGMARFGEDSERFTSSQQGLLTTLFILWCLIIIPSIKKIIDFTGLQRQLVCLMLIQTYFTSFFALWFQKKKYVYSYKLLTAITLIYTLLQPFVGIVGIKINTIGCDNGLLRIYTGVGIQILFGAIFLLIQFYNNRTFFVKDYWAFSLRNSIPLVPHYLSQVSLNQTDKLMINAFVGRSATAIYSVAHSAAFVIQVVTSYLNETFVPWMYEKLKCKNYEGIKTTITSLVVIIAAVVFALVLVAPEAMRFFAGKEYHDGIWIIPPLAISVFLIFVYVLFSDFELFYEKSTYVLISSIIGAISNLILNYIFIKKYGYLATGYTTIAGYFIMCCCHIAFTNMICKEKNISFSEIYNLGAICFIALILCVLCAVIMFFYNQALIRYFFFCGLILFFYLKRKAMMNFIFNLKK